MSIKLSSYIVPANNNSFFLLEDKFIKGGLHSCVDLAERDAINPVNLKKGMIAVTQDNNKLWILIATPVVTPPSPAVWEELVLGGGGGGELNIGIRQTLVHTTGDLAPEASEQFVLPMGKSCLLYNLSTSVGPCELRGFSTPARNETNPYKFIATESHLADDGTTYLSDGSSVLGRRYSVLMNLEDVVYSNLYWTVVNKKAASSVFTLTFSFLPLE